MLGLLVFFFLLIVGVFLLLCLADWLWERLLFEWDLLRRRRRHKQRLRERARRYRAGMF